MEGITQKPTLETDFFKIPIEEYEKDMNTGLSMRKKKEIIDLFTNFNRLRSKEEFSKIAHGLHRACRKGDLDLIKIYISETIEDDSKTLKFKIDRTNKTASLFQVDDEVKDLYVPRSIEHESTEYVITSICRIGSPIVTIEFSEDSEVKIIYRAAISFLKIKEIHLPKSLQEIKKGFCYYTPLLNEITISPLNDRLALKDGKFLLGKSDENNTEFDILLFASRDIEKAFIPSNIKVISKFAFQCCSKLRKIEIPLDSKLQQIEEEAFSFSEVEELYFPESLEVLGEGWCYQTERLTKITISPLNNRFALKDGKYLLGKSDENNDEFDILLFASRDIEEALIPPNIKIIDSFAFHQCKNLRKVEFPVDSNLQTIGESAFSFSSIEEVSIPSRVTTICISAFSMCFDLRKVEIQADSNLQAIESNAFAFTSIEKIFIPSKVSTLCENLFYKCENLTKVEFPVDSNLQTIESTVFSSSSIEEIGFPTSLKELKKGWCNTANKLNKITISPLNDRFIFIDSKYLLGKSDENKDEFDILLFARRDIEKAFIPSSFKVVASFAFENCEKLRNVEIQSNSNLQIIEENAFTFSGIEKIFIPSKVSTISAYAFYDCQNLKRVEIGNNSDLEKIGKCAFSSTDIFEIIIPPKVTMISKDAFSRCKNLQIVEISEKSRLNTFPLMAFSKCPKLTVMIPSSLKIIQ